MRCLAGGHRKSMSQSSQYSCLLAWRYVLNPRGRVQVSTLTWRVRVQASYHDGYG